MADRDESQDTDAAEAFEHLTQEVSTLQHRIEELVDAIQLKEPPDYAPTLGGIANELADIAGRLGAIEGHPALRVAPADYPRALERAGQDLMRTAAEKFEEASRAAARHTQSLAGIIGAARAKERQRQWLMISAAAALAAMGRSGSSQNMAFPASPAQIQGRKSWIFGLAQDGSNCSR